MTFHFTKCVEAHGHPSIIANDEILISAQQLFFHIPVTPELKIRFRKDLSINANDAVMHLYGFTGQPDNAFEKHYVFASHTDGDNVKTLWGSPAVDQGVNDAVISGFIQGEHAAALYPNRQE